MAAWTFAEGGAIGWLGVGWAAIAAAVTLQALRVRNAAVVMWTLVGLSLVSSVIFGVPVVSSAARAAAVDALALGPPSWVFLCWVGFACIAGAAIGLGDGLIRRMGAGATVLCERLGLYGEGKYFAHVTGSASLFGVSLAEPSDGRIGTKIAMAAMPVVACGAVAMFDKVMNWMWAGVNKTVGVDEHDAPPPHQPLAAPRVSRDMSESVAKTSGLTDRGLGVEEHVPDEAAPSEGKTTIAPPVRFDKLKSVMMPRRRVDLEASVVETPLEIAGGASADMARRVDAARVVEEKPAQAQTPPGPLDLWEEEEVAQWGLGLSPATLEGLRQFMSDDEVDEYVEQTLAREKARKEEEEREAISGPVVVEEQHDEATAEERAMALVDLFRNASGPEAQASYVIVNEFRQAPELHDLVVKLEPRAADFVAGLHSDMDDNALEVKLFSFGAKAAPQAVPMEAASSPTVVMIGNEDEGKSVKMVGERPVVVRAESSRPPETAAAAQPQVEVVETDDRMAGLKEKFEAVHAEFRAIVNAPRLDDAAFAAALEGTLASDPVKMKRFSADGSLVAALRGFTGDEISYDVTQRAIETLVRRAPTEASDPLCAAVVQILRDLPIEMYGDPAVATVERRHAETRFALVVLQDRVKEIVEFCRGATAEFIGTKEALEAAAAAQPVYAAAVEASSALQKLDNGQEALAALDSVLSRVRAAIALRDAPKAEVFERDSTVIATDENRKRGIAAALRHLMPKDVRDEIDNLRDIGRAARLLHVYLWRRAGVGGLPIYEKLPLYPALISMCSEMVLVAGVVGEKVNDSKNVAAILAGYDAELPAFLDEYNTEKGREALDARSKAIGENASEVSAIGEQIDELAREVERLRGENGDLVEQVHAEQARSPVDRAVDEIVRILEAGHAVVRHIEPGAASPARICFEQKDGSTVAFMFVDGMKARWRLMNENLVCDQMAASIDLARVRVAMRAISGVDGRGSFRVVLCDAAGVETGGEPAIARIEDLIGNDAGAMKRAGQFLVESRELTSLLQTE
ncbi:MAG TPA: hypothetical protein PLB34_12680 [Rhodoblastus sp.]|nr:hypothetical protein [Rhodoblastus sp.]